MIKRLLQLITDCLRRWRFAKNRNDRSQALSYPQSPVTPSSDSITYTLSRSEAVIALNRTLHYGQIQRPERDAIQSPHAEPDNTQADSIQIDLIKSSADAAYLCECQGRLGEAERLYQRAVTLSIRRFGEAHAAIAPHLSDLAKFYSAQQRYQQAKSLLEQTLNIQQQSPAILPVDKGETLYQLANIYRHLESYGRAEALYQQTLFIFRQCLGLEHARTQAVYDELMQMLAMVITSGQFDALMSELPPLDLDTLGDTYSWAKPDWMKEE